MNDTEIEKIVKMLVKDEIDSLIAISLMIERVEYVYSFNPVKSDVSPYQCIEHNALMFLMGVQTAKINQFQQALELHRMVLFLLSLTLIILTILIIVGVL